jgi:hypothetical protein
VAIVVLSVVLAGVPARAAAQAEPGSYYEIEDMLTEAEAPSERWWWTWIGVHLALFAGNATWAALTDDEGIRVDRLTGATSAALGTMMLLIFAPPAMSAADDVREHEEAPAELRDERALEIMRTTVRAQRRSRSVLAHLLVIGWGLLSGGFLWLGFDRPLSGALQLGSVVVIGELRILTHPSDLIDRTAGWAL